MDILKLIKERRTVREYKNKSISKKIIDKIIEAGIWAPSPHNSQPWKFIVIRNKFFKKDLIKKLNKESYKFLTSFGILLRNTLKIIEEAPVIILVYNDCFLSKRTKKFGEPYFSITHISEIQGVSAAIQNMNLTASYFGLGMAWLTMPLFIESVINKVFKNNQELVAVLALGYPEEKTKHKSFRKKLAKVVRYAI